MSAQTGVGSAEGVLSAEEQAQMALPEVQWGDDGLPAHMPKNPGEDPSLEEMQAYDRAKRAWKQQYPQEYKALLEKGRTQAVSKTKLVRFWDPEINDVTTVAYQENLPTFFWYPIDSTKPQFYSTGNDYADRLFYRNRMMHWMWHFAPQSYSTYFGPRPQLPPEYTPQGVLANRLPLVVEDVNYKDFVYETWPELDPSYQPPVRMDPEDSPMEDDHSHHEE